MSDALDVCGFLVLGDVDRFFVFVLFDGHGVMDMGAGASTQ